MGFPVGRILRLRLMVIKLPCAQEELHRHCRQTSNFAMNSYEHGETPVCVNQIQNGVKPGVQLFQIILNIISIVTKPIRESQQR